MMRNMLAKTRLVLKAW